MSSQFVEKILIAVFHKNNSFNADQQVCLPTLTLGILFFRSETDIGLWEAVYIKNNWLSQGEGVGSI